MGCSSLCVGSNLVAVFCGTCAFVTLIEQRRSLRLMVTPATCCGSAETTSKRQRLKAGHLEEGRHVSFCSALSGDGLWYAVVSEDKHLWLWETANWSLRSKRVVRRSCSRLIFSPSGRHVILADKSGDVYSYSITSCDVGRELLLGHVSMLLDVLISADERFIITCDRDEKIRVSHYPDAYEIHSFCLGHTSFVSSLTLLSDGQLVSVAADGTLRLWQPREGVLRATYRLEDDGRLSPDDGGVEGDCPLEKVIAAGPVVCYLIHGKPMVGVCTVSGNSEIRHVQSVELSDTAQDLAFWSGTLWLLLSDYRLEVFRWDEKQLLFLPCCDDEISSVGPFLANCCRHLTNVPTMYDQLIAGKVKQSLYRSE